MIGALSRRGYSVTVTLAPLDAGGCWPSAARASIGLPIKEAQTNASTHESRFDHRRMKTLPLLDLSR
jgi:hypothetical protein